MKTTIRETITPPQLAKIWGVGVDKVLCLIKSGELKAINLAVNPNGKRCRYKIKLSEIARFEENRAARSSAPNRSVKGIGASRSRRKLDQSKAKIFF